MNRRAEPQRSVQLPRDRVIKANRLKLHLLEWGDAGVVVLLLHGFLEHAHVWDWVAPRLAEAGYHVCALDWRGHGDSEWIGAGGYYHFIDYVADLAALIRALGPAARTPEAPGGRAGVSPAGPLPARTPEASTLRRAPEDGSGGRAGSLHGAKSDNLLDGPVVLVGHSMGGGAALLYAGTEPERVQALVSIEGLGVPDTDPSTVPARVVSWLRDLERAEERQRGTIGFDAAVQRLHERFPRFSAAVARHLVEFGTRDAAGARVWKFDPLHQTRAPQPTSVAQAREFWKRVSCPVLYVDGAESGLRLSPADIDERLTALRARHVTISDSGHHPHLEQPEALVGVLLEFLSGLRAGS